MKDKKILKIGLIFAYFVFIIISFLINFKPGKQIGDIFITFTINMMKIIPCAFILIGLFEVWVKKETVIKNFGERSGFKGYIWAILLATTTVGGLYVSFPVAYSLAKKGAKLSVIFTYVSASGICRVPMTIFEISFMGLKFSLIRFMVSLPLVIISSIFLGNYLVKRNYKIMEGK